MHGTRFTWMFTGRTDITRQLVPTMLVMILVINSELKNLENSSEKF